MRFRDDEMVSGKLVNECDRIIESQRNEISERQETEDSLTESYIQLKEHFMEAMDILSNVWYWETCPKDYQERIVKLQLTEEAKL
jgi:hypothetical protein